MARDSGSTRQPTRNPRVKVFFQFVYSWRLLARRESRPRHAARCAKAGSTSTADQRLAGHAAEQLPGSQNSGIGLPG